MFWNISEEKRMWVEKRIAEMTLDGVVSDNSELGQEYEIWISIKFEGSGFSAAGQPNKDVSIYIDRVIVIQKTSNKDKKI